MTIHAYSEDYVISAQRILGDMLDFAVNVLDMEADQFFSLFAFSDAARQFGSGNASYVAGKTGCELAREVLREAGLKEPDEPDEMYADKSPEYWAGWALAYYQWYSGRSFQRIYRAVSIEAILNIYPVLHEADIMKFVGIIDEKLAEYYTDTNLKYFRTIAGMSQRELAERADIPLRQIQLFEQKQRDINKTQALNLLKLARVLNCQCEDLLQL